MAITKREADDLRRVVKARFEVLHDQVAQRRTEIKNRVEDTIVAEHAAKVKRVQDRIDKLREKVEAFNAEVDAEVKAISKSAPKGGDISVTCDRYNPDSVVIDGVIRASQLTVGIASLASKVQQRTQEIIEAAGLASLNLRHREIEFLEKLTLGSIETKDAQEFFDSLPVVDEYLPLPSVKQLKELSS